VDLRGLLLRGGEDTGGGEEREGEGKGKEGGGSGKGRKEGKGSHRYFFSATSSPGQSCTKITTTSHHYSLL